MLNLEGDAPGDSHELPDPIRTYTEHDGYLLQVAFQYKEMSGRKCYQLAPSRLQKNVLRDALRLGEANAKVLWGRTTVKKGLATSRH